MAESKGPKKPQETRVAVPQETPATDDEAPDRPVDKPSTLSPVSVPQQDIDKALSEHSQDDIPDPGAAPPADNSPAAKAASAAASMMAGKGKAAPPGQATPAAAPNPGPARPASPPANVPRTPAPPAQRRRQKKSPKEFLKLIAPGAAIYIILIVVLVLLLAQAYKWYRGYRTKQIPENPAVAIEAEPTPVPTGDEHRVVCGKDSTLNIQEGMLVAKHCQRSPELVADLEGHQSESRKLSCVNIHPTEDLNGNIIYKNCVRE